MIGEGNYEIMGPIAVAICIPPIGMGVATFVNKRKFQSGEREAGKAAFTMGLFGITEGAIPFAAQDPLRVIPSIMAGSMTGSVIAMLGNVGDRVAHGGPIVAVLGAIDNVLMFFIAVIAGVLVTAFSVNFLKKDITNNQAGQPVEEDLVDNVSHGTSSEEKSIDKLTDIMNLDLIDVDLTGNSRNEVIEEMINKLDDSGVLTSKADFKQSILNRENESTTGIGMNIAIPHGKSDSVKVPRVVFGKKRDGVDWNSLDGTDAKLIFMIAVPRQREGNEHLKILQMLSRKLMDDKFRNELLAAQTKEEAYQLLEQIY
jgi:PTS system fructose-specific IIC component